MDYDGSPETAEPLVEVALFDPSWSVANKQLALAWPLLKHEKTKWVSREDEYTERIGCRNLEFVMNPRSVDLHAQHQIDLVFAPREKPAVD